MTGLHTPVTYGELVITALRRYASTDRVAFRQDGVDWTYAAVADRLARLTALLVESGLRPGEGVGVLSPNRLEVWLVQTAPTLAGGRYTALSPLGSLDDHVYACDEAELRFLFVDPAYAERAAALASRCNSITHVFTFGPADVGSDLTRALDDIGPRPLAPGPHTPDDLAWLLYTGGTTGIPKAAMLPERAVAQMVMSVSVGWDLPQHKRYLACAPISHAAGMLVTPTLLSGGTVLLMRSFDPVQWLETVERESATLGLLVPTMIYAVLDALDSTTVDLGTLETVMYGASPISPTRLAEGIDRIGPVFAQLYGQTECCGIVASLARDQHDPTDLHRLTACGYPMAGARVDVRDDGGASVADGEPGEICVQGASVMTGYFKQPELTAATITDGWLRTGDIAVRDPDGLLYIVDRKKDMIISGGFNVFPREIEDALASHPGVASAAVVGVPHDKWGEAVTAIVVTRSDAAVDEDDLRALVRDRKGAVYVPKSFEFVDALPLTPVGKVDKKLLREQRR